MGRSRGLVVAIAAIVTTTIVVGTGTPSGAAEKSSASAPVALAAAPVPGPRLVTITIPAPAGEIPSKWLSYPGPPRANVLLPAGYDPSRRYPLLVLLHGLNSDYDWWAQSGLVTELDGLDAIVVMPEGGSGWYADWWNNGERGGPSWESYELNNVIPTILAQYPILPQRQYHAIAGVSMGGLGAVYLGGRLPGFFGSVASLSGFVDTGFFAPITDPAMGITALAPFEGDGDFSPVLGPADGFYAKGHDPTLLTMNLKQTRLFVTSGTGVPSRAGLSAPGATPQVLEGSLAESLIISPMNWLYDSALVHAGVAVTFRSQPGGHDLPDFANELKAMLAWGPFNPVVTDPASWVNDTVATSGQLWDIGYRFDRSPGAVVQFRRSGTTLSIGAAGSAVTITTSGGCTIHTATPATITIPGRPRPGAAAASVR